MSAHRTGFRFQASLGKTPKDFRVLLLELDVSSGAGELKCSHTGGDAWTYAVADSVAAGAPAAASDRASEAPATGPQKCNAWDRTGRNPAMNVYVHLTSLSDGTAGSGHNGSAPSGSGGDSEEAGAAADSLRCKLGVLVQHALPRLAERLGGYSQLALDWVTWQAEAGGAPCVDSVAALGGQQDEEHWIQLRVLAKEKETGAGTTGGSSPPPDSMEELALRRAKDTLVEAARFFGPQAAAKVGRLTVRKLYQREYHFFDGEIDVADSRRHALEWAVGLAEVEHLLTHNAEARAKLNERLTGPTAGGSGSAGPSRKRSRPTGGSAGGGGSRRVVLLASSGPLPLAANGSGGLAATAAAPATAAAAPAAAAGPAVPSGRGPGPTSPRGARPPPSAPAPAPAPVPTTTLHQQQLGLTAMVEPDVGQQLQPQKSPQQQQLQPQQQQQQPAEPPGWIAAPPVLLSPSPRNGVASSTGRTTPPSPAFSDWLLQLQDPEPSTLGISMLRHKQPQHAQHQLQTQSPPAGSPLARREPSGPFAGGPAGGVAGAGAALRSPSQQQQQLQPQHAEQALEQELSVLGQQQPGGAPGMLQLQPTSSAGGGSPTVQQAGAAPPLQLGAAQQPLVGGSLALQPSPSSAAAAAADAVPASTEPAQPRAQRPGVTAVQQVQPAALPQPQPQEKESGGGDQELVLLDAALEAWEKHDIVRAELAEAQAQLAQQAAELAAAQRERDVLQQEKDVLQQQLAEALQQLVHQQQGQGQRQALSKQGAAGGSASLGVGGSGSAGSPDSRATLEGQQGVAVTAAAEVAAKAAAAAQLADLRALLPQGLQLQLAQLFSQRRELQPFAAPIRELSCRAVEQALSLYAAVASGGTSTLPVPPPELQQQQPPQQQQLHLWPEQQQYHQLQLQRQQLLL